LFILPCYAVHSPNADCKPYKEGKPQHDILAHKRNPVKQHPQTPEYENTADYQGNFRQNQFFVFHFLQQPPKGQFYF